MDTSSNRVTDFLAHLAVSVCVFALGWAIGTLERECPKPRGPIVYQRGLEIYSTEELQRIVNARRRMEKVKEKEKAK